MTTSVELRGKLKALTARLSRHDRPKIKAGSVGAMEGCDDDPITAQALYPRWAEFLKPRDIVIGETGTASMGSGFPLIPNCASFHSQMLWGVIGWATPAAFGAAIAAPERHDALITGDGPHQLTVQQIGQFGRLGLKPVLFVLNNNGYLIERMLCKDTKIASNDIAPWDYIDGPLRSAARAGFAERLPPELGAIGARVKLVDLRPQSPPV